MIDYCNRAYVHNIFIEIIAHFGVIVGSLLLALLVLSLLKALTTKSPEIYDMFIIWTCVGLVPLLVSSSYLLRIDFWVLLGLMLGGMRPTGIKKYEDDNAL